MTRKEIMENETLGKAMNYDVYEGKEHREVIKPWGKYITSYRGSGFLVKTIVVQPGHRLSLQRHRWRDEHWYIVEGSAYVFKNNSWYTLYSSDSINIPKGVWHRVENIQQTPLIFVEVQTGNCFEDDIERKEDDYGR